VPTFCSENYEKHRGAASRQGARSPRERCSNSQIQLLASANIVTNLFPIKRKASAQANNNSLFRKFIVFRCLNENFRVFRFISVYFRCKKLMFLLFVLRNK
ncbi:MAG: hypothetical protein IKX44_00595, partial [Prevotella sp.]|nr:hypothetical protein [Prevotella sp.]